jgi:hypothetical protein
MPTYDAGEAVAIGDADPAQPKRRGLIHELAGVRAAAEKAEIAGGDQLHISHFSTLADQNERERKPLGIGGYRRTNHQHLQLDGLPPQINR